MRISTNNAFEQSRRPWLTQASDRLIDRLSWAAPEPHNSPLRAVPRRLLVVKVFGMGDSILIRSLIDHLLSGSPEMEVGVMVGPATRELMTLGAGFRVHQYSQQTLTLNSALKCLREVRSCRYDAVLNFEQRSTAGAAFLAATGIPVRLGFLPTLKRSPKALFLTHAERFQEKHSMWQSFVRLARMVDPGLSETLMPTSLKCGAASEAWAVEWLRRNIANRRAVAVHLGSQSLDFRRWPLDRFVEFAERVRRQGHEDLSVVLTGTAPERPLINAFIHKYSGHAVDASESKSLEQTAALLRRCSLLVSNDTGIMHLGAAMGTPTVGLFGPNSPRYWAPIGARATYVYDTRVACSPCLNLYANRWPLECANPDTSRCMLDIQVDSVISAARRVVAADWFGRTNVVDEHKARSLH